MGAVDGALSALPSGSSGLYCNKNSTLARTYLNTTLGYFNKNDAKNGMKNLYNMMSTFDEVSNNCYYAIQGQITVNWSNFFSGDILLQNVLFNAGFMFTDILTVATTDASLYSNYPYILASSVGDFCMRFFYRDTSLQ